MTHTGWTELGVVPRYGNLCKSAEWYMLAGLTLSTRRHRRHLSWTFSGCSDICEEDEKIDSHDKQLSCH